VVGQRFAHEVPGVARSGEDVKARGGQDMDDTVAKERLVLADDNADRRMLTHAHFTVPAHAV
jgi:hypothetical protein